MTAHRLSDIISRGPLPYTHHYYLSMGTHETANHLLTPPTELADLAAQGATVIADWYGDMPALALGGKVTHARYASYAHPRFWAEAPDGPLPEPAELPRECWRYIDLALGRPADTAA